MIKIYHNPRCSKSRQGIAVLEDSGKEFEIIKYLDTNISFEELSNIIKKLGIAPIDLVRKNEKVWKDNYKHLTLTNKEIIEILIKNPKLIERPIVVNKENAVIGRPTENIKTIL
ncbi:arsenate reductase (glutaredoxin) [uncultured Lacinutrix sp.]|uniref:arsenate reductase (glutaredoxin) n=1 Tax=uncultured Lacinutrix sp. TaxID=574032 RepID=UPI0026185E7B|nr:arsenate reductase (glutaredoxin) [uncultured Lacinutrix sp.]